MAITLPTIPLATGIKTMTIVVQTNANTLSPTMIAGDSNNGLNRLYRLFHKFSLGAWRSSVNMIQGGVYATGTATFASVVATNTLVIGGVTITAVNSGATSVQFNVGATDTITAADAVTTINALTTMNKVVQATSSGAVITIACLVPGTIGNLVTLSATGGTITVAAALTGGTDGSKTYLSHGL